MLIRFARSFLVLALFASTVSVSAQSLPNAVDTRLFLPLVSTPPTPNPFGFDMPVYSSDKLLAFGQATNPRWARAGDVLWSKIEPQPNGRYDWSSLGMVEANIRRLRAAGVEPTLIIQQSPAWAQAFPGHLCSPPSPAALDAFTKYVQALVARYAQGPMAVHYWEIWNEPDVRPGDIDPNDGIGCWANPAVPHFGGSYYGEVLKRIYPVIKQANPRATVMAGSLLYQLSEDTPSEPNISRRFLDGMLASGAGKSFDGLSFHAYGEYGPSSLLLLKVLRIREQLAAYGLADKPLYATEIAAMCGGFEVAKCEPNYNEWVQRQANFAARIYAEASALDLEGAFWYSLSGRNPGFRFSHLIDDVDGQFVPRPAYFAFRNSARLLQGSYYAGEPLKELTNDQLEEVQVLKFRKANSTLYVLWVPQLDFPRRSYNLLVPPGSRALCTQNLNLDAPNHYQCNDADSAGRNDGVIKLAVISQPQYIEVFDQ